MKYNPCDYNDANLLVRDDITVTSAPATQVMFKNCAPFTKYFTNIDCIIIGDAEDLNLVLSMHNLIDYRSNYFETRESFWFYLKDEATDFNADIAKSCKYKDKLLESPEAQPNPNNNVVINERNFYYQAIDSDIKRFEGIRKLYHCMFIRLRLYQKSIIDQ